MQIKHREAKMSSGRESKMQRYFCLKNLIYDFLIFLM